MIENVSGELPGTADLDHLSDRARLQIVDIPPNDFLSVIAKNNLPEIAVGFHPVHEGEKPTQGLAIIMSPERMTTSELVQATQERFDIKFGGLQAGHGLTERTGRESRSHTVHDSAKRSRCKLYAGGEFGPSQAGHGIQRILPGPERARPMETKGENRGEAKSLQQLLRQIVC